MYPIPGDVLLHKIFLKSFALQSQSLIPQTLSMYFFYSFFFFKKISHFEYFEFKKKKELSSLLQGSGKLGPTAFLK